MDAIGALVLAGGSSFTIYEAEKKLPYIIAPNSRLARPKPEYETRNLEGYLLFYVRKIKNKSPELWIEDFLKNINGCLIFYR